MQGTWFAIWILLMTSACAVPDSVKAPVPAHFHILSQSEITDGMQQMADRVRLIASTRLNRELSLEQQRKRILPQLDDIKTIAGNLDGDGAVTNYSVINRYMGSFLFDVDVARQFAQRDPPNLIPAQQLINSCLSCHESI